MSCWESVQSYLSAAVARLRSLKSAPRELWLSYVNVVFCAYADYGAAVVCVLYLQELGFSDQQAGLAYGIYGAIGTRTPLLSARWCLG